MSEALVPAKAATGLKSMIGRKMTKKVKFMGEDILISKLSVSEVLQIQDKAKELEDHNKKVMEIAAAKEAAAANGEVYVGEPDEEIDAEKEGFEVLKIVIRAGAEGASDLEDSDFNTLPLDELSTLSTEIMKFSGIGRDAGK